MIETWIDKREREKLKEKLANKFKGDCIPAVRKKTKGRAKGGIILAINKKLRYVEWKECSKQMAEIKQTYNEKTWIIMVVQPRYGRDNQIEGEEKYLLIGGGGDFNARTGEEIGLIRVGEEEGKFLRRTKNKKKVKK
ncbi:hypothetical protein K0M31_001932 [Melipona bicolor]|uniref:Uncharacterized protein n=1 Tax=Melipona bicolor TaxID=60889 RepID=A0AA40GGR7_9HYME|nr:hypothetical protein K0M31_001932 [Melipona bicolor]